MTLHRVRYWLRRMDTWTGEAEDGTRLNVKGWASLRGAQIYMEGVSDGGSWCRGQRRGPGIGHPWWFYPPRILKRDVRKASASNVSLPSVDELTGH